MMRTCAMARSVAAGCLALMAALPLLVHADLRSATPQEKALDEQVFAEVDRVLADRLGDIQSVAIAVQGRVAHEFYRDGKPDLLRDVQSVDKSTVAVLVGMAIQQGRIANLDVPVAQLMPEWLAMQPDPRAASITLRHLLTMTTGFDIDRRNGYYRQQPGEAWARPLTAAPGERFAYDNATVALLSAVLAKATGQRVEDYAREQLVRPLGMAEPGYERGLSMRTVDMARLGQLMLDGGLWNGKRLLPADFVVAATQPQHRGGPPVGLPFGYLWWATPADGASRNTFMASGYGGQLVWVYPPLSLVVAVTSTVSPDSQRHGHAVQLVRGALVPAVERRLALAPR